jgi:hypothetical protein
MTAVARPANPGESSPVAPNGVAPKPRAPSEGFAGVLLHPAFLAGGVFVFVLSFLLPEKGLGIALCWFKVQSGLPCPGCGLTRSVTAAGHFDLAESVHYHPFGAVIWVLAALLTVSAIIGGRARGAVRARLVRHSRAIAISGWVTLFAFLVYGFVRVGVAAFYPETFAHL